MLPAIDNGECDNQVTADEVFLTQRFHVDRSSILLFYQVWSPKLFMLLRSGSFKNLIFDNFQYQFLWALCF
jgi:hypothetical protein